MPDSELISRPLASALFGVAVPLLLLLAAGIIARRSRPRAVRLALAGVSLSGLWWSTNAVLDRTGPDSLLGLGLCAALFIGLGIFFGRTKP